MNTLIKPLLLLTILLLSSTAIYAGGPDLEFTDVTVKEVDVDSWGTATLVLSGKCTLRMSSVGPNGSVVTPITKVSDKFKLTILKSAKFKSSDEATQWANGIKARQGQKVDLIQCWFTRTIIQGDQIIEVIATEVRGGIATVETRQDKDSDAPVLPGR